jgi:magnesium transporter
LVLKYLKQVNQKIKLAEDNLEKSIQERGLQALLQIEKCLVFFMTSLKGMIFYCTESRYKIPKEHFDLDLLEDVEIELRQAQETTNIYRHTNGNNGCVCFCDFE